jgi:Cas7 group CRISPR-associated protein Csh2
MSDFNRGTGLLIIEVCGSNPNGDPDSEGEPRTLGADRRGLISPVSLKRKLRDLVADTEGAAWQEAQRVLKLGTNGRRYEIVEQPTRKFDDLKKMKSDIFIDTYWDARIFGNTLLEAIKGDVNKMRHFISTGTVQFGPGVSVAPVDIEYQTWTNKSPVQEGTKTRGMAPLAWRFVQHAIYTMPFFVNPLVAKKSGCSADDVNLMKFLIPFAYSATASVARPNVQILHAWYGEHKSPLGSCPDYLMIDAMTPRKKVDPDQPSRSRVDYLVPQESDFPNEVRSRLASFEDLCTKNWMVSRT